MIRQYEHPDFPELLAIEQSVFSQYDAYFMMEMCQWCKDSIFVAEYSGHVIGYIMGVLTETGGGRIFSLGVDGLYQGLGIGSQLICKLLDEFSQHGIGEVILEVRASNMKAQRLYQRFGFVPYELQTGYYPDNEDAVVMRSTIPANRCGIARYQ